MWEQYYCLEIKVTVGIVNIFFGGESVIVVFGCLWKGRYSLVILEFDFVPWEKYTGKVNKQGKDGFR